MPRKIFSHPICDSKSKTPRLLRNEKSGKCLRSTTRKKLCACWLPTRPKARARGNHPGPGARWLPTIRFEPTRKKIILLISPTFFRECLICCSAADLKFRNLKFLRNSDVASSVTKKLKNEVEGSSSVFQPQTETQFSIQQNEINYDCKLT